MTWIKIVPASEYEKVRKAAESQRQLYPIEYATPVHPTLDGETVESPWMKSWLGRRRKIIKAPRSPIRIGLCSMWYRSQRTRRESLRMITNGCGPLVSTTRDPANHSDRLMVQLHQPRSGWVRRWQRIAIQLN